MKCMFWKKLCSKIIILVATLSMLFTLQPQISYSILNVPNKQITSIKRTLYIDRTFSDKEIIYITSAALEWTYATHGIANISIVSLPTDQKIDFETSIIILHVTQDFPDILLVDSLNDNTTIGFYHEDVDLNSIELVTSRIPDIEFEEVVMHEIGHALGLSHTDKITGVGTLMYPYINFGAKHITSTDLFNFCVIYHCDSTKF